MAQRILGTALLLFPLFASADMLIMKDGTTIRGTFNSANTTRMSFTEYNGNRRDVSVYDIQELRFGNERQQQQPYSSSNSYPNGGPQPGPGPNPDMRSDLDRLRQDLRTAMDNNNVPPDQRRILEDARETLRGAVERNRDGRPVNPRDIRLALDSIRNAADRMQRQDREQLNDDIRRVNVSLGAQQGRDY